MMEMTNYNLKTIYRWWNANLFKELVRHPLLNEAILQYFWGFPVEATNVAIVCYLLRVHIPQDSVIHIPVGELHCTGILALLAKYSHFRHVASFGVKGQPVLTMNASQCIEIKNEDALQIGENAGEPNRIQHVLTHLTVHAMQPPVATMV